MASDLTEPPPQRRAGVDGRQQECRRGGDVPIRSRTAASPV